MDLFETFIFTEAIAIKTLEIMDGVFLRALDR